MRGVERPLVPGAGSPAPRLGRRPAQARRAALQREGRRGRARRGPDAQVARIPLPQQDRGSAPRPCSPAFTRTPLDRARPQRPSTCPSASASAELPPAEHALCRPRSAPAAAGDHHDGDQQRMQHQGALPISAPEPGRDPAGRQVHPHLPRGRQRRHWGECLSGRGFRGGGRWLNPTPRRASVPACHSVRPLGCSSSIAFAQAPPLPCTRMAGCGLAGPLPSLCRVGGGYFPPPGHPLPLCCPPQCPHPLPPVLCFPNVFPPPGESASSLCYWLASLPPAPRKGGKGGLVDGLDPRGTVQGFCGDTQENGLWDAVLHHSLK